MRLKTAVITSVLVGLLVFCMFPLRAIYGYDCPDVPHMDASGQLVGGLCPSITSEKTVWFGWVGKILGYGKERLVTDVQVYVWSVSLAAIVAIVTACFVFMCLTRRFGLFGRLPYRRFRWLFVAVLALSLFVLLPLRQDRNLGICLGLSESIGSVGCTSTIQVWAPLFNGVHDENVHTPFYNVDIARNAVIVGVFVVICCVGFKYLDQRRMRGSK